MKNRFVIWLALAVVVFGLQGVNGAGEPTKPNVIFFLMDDLGWNDLGYTGGKFYESPNIDRLSQRGVIFTRAYAAPICSPSRASILTGLDPAHTGVTLPTGGDKLEVLKAHVQPRIYTEEEKRTNWKNLPGGMQAPPNQRAMSVVSASRLSTGYTSIAKVFKANGYRTAHFGKWHVGPAPYSPLEHGFDVDVPHLNTPGPPPPGHFGPWPDWEEERGPEAKGRQVDDVLADHAVRFIQQNKDRPFYMNFWTYGVHIPFQAQKELIDYFKTKADPKCGQRNPLYAAMVKHTDDAIGRVWQAVEEAGLADKTVVVFYSDNGAVNWGMSGFCKQNGIPEGTPVSDNSPLRGGKGDIYEGGVRVPGFVIWPGVTKPGIKCDLPVNTRDLFPTLAEICGLKGLPKFDGRSIAPALAGKPMEAQPIFTHYPHYGGGWSKGNSPATTVMVDDWKLIRFYFDGPGQTQRYELYNLKEDPGETLDYHRSRPELVAKLDQLIDGFVKETGAVLPQPNPAYHGANKGDFKGLPYEVLEPAIKRGERFPLIVCLGSDDGNPAYEELRKMAIQNRYSMLLLAVTCPAARSGDALPDYDKVAALIEKVFQDYPVQSRQVYLTGQGKGGACVWNLAMSHPELFAAVLPVGGRGEPARVVALKDLPVWAFGGAHDPAVATTRSLIESLKATGSTVAKYTEHAQNEQVQMDNVWGNLDVLDWLFAQSRPLGKPAARK